MASALNLDGLLTLLAGESTVVVPNFEASRAVRERFDRQQGSFGHLAWEPPRVFAWSEWLESLWKPLVLEGIEDRVLLNRLQEESLWAEIISTAERSRSLSPGNAAELAGLARSALELAADHRAQERVPASADSTETKAFARWLKSFFERCRSERLLPRALLEATVAEHLRRPHPRYPAELHLAGFAWLSPAKTLVLDRLRSLGSTVEVHALEDIGHGQKPRLRVEHSSPQEELRWAVRRIRQLFRGAGPQSVALILPDPAAERATLEPILREILAPELEPVGTDLSSTPWHFTVGPPLSSTTMLRQALTLLRWCVEELSLEEAGALILSPYLAHGDSFELRARFEMYGLRRSDRLHPELSLQEFLLLTRSGRARRDENVCFLNLHALQRLIGEVQVGRAARSHAEWADFVREALRTAGWPGTRAPTPEEFRTTEAWEGLLDRLGTLDVSGRRLRLADFLQLLRTEANRAAAPSALNNAAVTILGLEEAEGCCFDVALILHATEANLPRAERPHALLGWSLQHGLGLPGTDPSKTHTRTHQMLKSLCERCGETLLLSASADGNGELRPTPLAAGLGFRLTEPTVLLPPETPSPVIALDSVVDNTPLPPLRSPEVRGGARVLELQAACGFRAFASLRLRADVPEIRRLGLDARGAGNLLHTAMEVLWKELKNLSALKALQPAERHAVVKTSVELAFQHKFGVAKERTTELRSASVPPPAVDGWTPAYLELLQDRLKQVIGRWLEHELERAEFTVLPPEEEQILSLGPLELKIRPDRIDQVDGGFVFIDYKTSASLSTGDWLGERPSAPQLPLYTLLRQPAEVRGVAFARLRPGKDMHWMSLVNQPETLPGRHGKSSHAFEDLLEQWRLELARLATEFAGGNTDIDPKVYPGTCRYCDHRLLCRVDPTLLLASDPADEHSLGEEQRGGESG